MNNLSRRQLIKAGIGAVGMAAAAPFMRTAFNPDASASGAVDRQAAISSLIGVSNSRVDVEGHVTNVIAFESWSFGGGAGQAFFRKASFIVERHIRNQIGPRRPGAENVSMSDQISH